MVCKNQKIQRGCSPVSPRFRNAINFVFGLLIIVGILYGLFIAVRGAYLILASLSSDIAVAIIAAAAAISVSVLSVVLGKLYEHKAMIQKEHREKKVPVYEDLIEFMFKLLMNSKVGNPVSQEEMVRFMSDFNRRALVWGADDVLAAWIKWRRLANDEMAVKANPMKLIFLYEELVYAIRRDLGHSNRRLVTGDILATFINDIDKHLPKINV
jgi:hypothetical protein